MRSRQLLAAALILALSAGTAFYLTRPEVTAPADPAAPASPLPLPPPLPVSDSSLPATRSPLLPPTPPPPLPADLAPLAEPATYRSDASAAEVFRRAFWREPTPADRILHAERREWVSARDGVRRWQWFLVVEPGPELTAWLRGNPFRLAPRAPADVQFDPDTQPAWFPADLGTLGDITLSQSPDAAMTQIEIRSTGRFYLADRGHGFAAAVAPPSPAAPAGGYAPGRELPLRIPGDVRPKP